MSVAFVYCPRTGDKMISALAGAEVGIVTWPNGSRHIVGGVRLAYETATAGEWWRAAAGATAAAIVAAVGPQGGVAAWDERGTVSLVVPVRWAFQAHGRMRAAAEAAAQAWRRSGGPVSWEIQEAALIAAGAAMFVAVDGSLMLAPADAVSSHPLEEGWEKEIRFRDLVPERIEGGKPTGS